MPTPAQTTKTEKPDLESDSKNTETETHPVELYLQQQASALHRQLTANFEVFDTEYTGLRENLEDPTMISDIMIASNIGAIPNTTIGSTSLYIGTSNSIMIKGKGPATGFPNPSYCTETSALPALLLIIRAHIHLYNIKPHEEPGAIKAY